MGERLVSGDTSTGYMVMKVGWISFSSTRWSKASYRAVPQVRSQPSRSMPLASAALQASSSSEMASKSTPTYSLTASIMVMRFQPGVRSISLPSQVTR